MSFDLTLVHFKNGDAEPISEPAVVLNVLREYCKDKADEFGFYVVELADGSSIEFSARGLESGSDFSSCSFHLRGLTPDVISFIYRIAHAGDMVIFNPQGMDEPENPSVICLTLDQKQEIPENVVKNPIVCNSLEHLGKLLGFGFDGWSEYRDRVVGGGKNP